MALAIYRTYKYSGISGFEREWCNQYMLSVGSIGDNQECFNHAMRLVNFERWFHLDHVEFRRVVVHSNVVAVEEQNLPPAAVFGFAGGYPVGARATDFHMDYKYCLTWKKSVTKGRPGRIWMRGCLNHGDVTENEGERVGLLDGDWWRQQYIDWARPSLDNALGAMRVPQMADRDRLDNGAVPVVALSVHAVSITNRSLRLRKKHGTPGQGMYSQVSTLSTAVAGYMRDMLLWEAIYQEFVPTAAKDYTLNTIGGAKQLAAAIESFLDEQDSVTNEQLPFNVRYGITEASIRAICAKIKESYDKDATEINKILPYQFPDGDMFFHHSDLLDLKDYIIKYEPWIATLNDVDWLNPRLRGAVDQTTEPPIFP
jgi:hypothetical protein